MGGKMHINAWRLGLIVAMSVSFTSAAHSNDLLEKMDGRWKGKGWAKRDVDGAREVVRCRLHNKYFPKKAELLVSGKCVVPGKKFDLKGAVAAQDGSMVVTGRWANPLGFGSTSVKGTHQGNRVVLNFSAPDPKTKKNIKQQMDWQISASGFRIINRVRDGGKDTLSDLKFRR